MEHLLILKALVLSKAVVESQLHCVQRLLLVNQKLEEQLRDVFEINWLRTVQPREWQVCCVFEQTLVRNLQGVVRVLQAFLDHRHTER